MMPLAERGLAVVGVDQAAGYIERARGRGGASRLGAGGARHRRGRDSSHRRRSHAAFNWWTSFGYGVTDAENREMLARAFESLVPGGRFALDTMNVPGVLRHFQRDVVVRRQTARGEVLLLRETTLDLRAGRMNKRWTYFVDGERKVEHPSSVRLYMPESIVASPREASVSSTSRSSGASPASRSASTAGGSSPSGGARELGSGASGPQAIPSCARRSTTVRRLSPAGHPRVARLREPGDRASSGGARRARRARAHERFTDEELFARVGRLRRALYTEPEAHALLAAMAEEASASIQRRRPSTRRACGPSSTVRRTIRGRRRSTTRIATPGTRTRGPS